ncbi:SAM-dependent methyltransferase [Streptomyces sp. NPDC051018]|uniref:SAM-dependent methyltransferase n=1 Tax=Streptomyces sp. NPDC051018 TaxID=3365639 RepID=UPI0037A7A90C
MAGHDGGAIDRTGAMDRVDTTRAHTARAYDYLLGGKDHYPVDAEAGAALIADWPAIRVTARQNRLFIQRVVRYPAREAGVRQFLGIGTGLPTSPNLHEVAQRERPDAVVVYVDNDPIVLAHAQALLTSSPEGRTAYVDADMRRPETITESEAFRKLLDRKQPVALTIIGMLHFIEPPADRLLVRRLLDPLPSGSFLAISAATADFAPDEVDRAAARYRSKGVPFVTRDREQVAAFLDGLEPIEPEVAQLHRRRPGPEQTAVAAADIGSYGAVARKP